MEPDTAAYLQQVQGSDRGCVHSRKIPKRLGNAVVIAVDDQRPLAVHIAPVPHLSLAPSDILAVLGLGSILVSAQLLEDLDSLAGLGDALRTVINNQRDLRDLQIRMLTTMMFTPGPDKGLIGGQCGTVNC